MLSLQHDPREQQKVGFEILALLTTAYGPLTGYIYESHGVDYENTTGEDFETIRDALDVF